MENNSVTINGITFINCTPHPVTIDGIGTIVPSGVIPRVSMKRVEQPAIAGCIRFFTQSKGEVAGLPDYQEGTIIIVSGMVVDALGDRRLDCVRPDTEDADRNEKGHIVSVKGLAR